MASNLQYLFCNIDCITAFSTERVFVTGQTMDNHSTFIAATLGLPTSWIVKEACIVADQSLHISVESTPGVHFVCPKCGATATLESQAEELWHHDSFLNKKTQLRASVPYIDCPSGCGLQRINPPWQHSNSKFILLTDEKNNSFSS